MPQGCYVNDKREGLGKLVLSHGGHYEGEFKDDDPTGKGTWCDGQNAWYKEGEHGVVYAWIHSLTHRLDRRVFCRFIN